jgi:hypothetical protein
VRRALAILGAVGMVVVAITVRRGLDDDGGGGGRPRGGDDEAVVVCARDLLQYCEALGDGFTVRDESAAETASAIEEGTLADDVDGWITTSAWVEVVDSRAPGALGDSEALAASPTVVATAPGRFDAVTELCASDDVWACLGDAAGRLWGDLGAGDPGWGELKVGFTDPDSAVGLSVLASASAGFFGGVDFATNDLRAGEFETWLATLAEPSADGDPDAALTLATRTGEYSAAGSVAAVVDGLADTRGVRSVEPKVEVVATVVAVGVHGQEIPDLDAVRDALVGDGWGGAAGAEVAPTLKPGVMAALHTLWREVTT